MQCDWGRSEKNIECGNDKESAATIAGIRLLHIILRVGTESRFSLSWKLRPDELGSELNDTQCLCNLLNGNTALNVYLRPSIFRPLLFPSNNKTIFRILGNHNKSDIITFIGRRVVVLLRTESNLLKDYSHIHCIDPVNDEKCFRTKRLLLLFSFKCNDAHIIQLNRSGIQFIQIITYI